jgi:hypothetical protein
VKKSVWIRACPSGLSVRSLGEGGFICGYFISAKSASKKSEKSSKNVAKYSKIVQKNSKFSKFFKIFTKTCVQKNLQTLF